MFFWDRVLSSSSGCALSFWTTVRCRAPSGQTYLWLITFPGRTWVRFASQVNAQFRGLLLPTSGVLCLSVCRYTASIRTLPTGVFGCRQLLDSHPCSRGVSVDGKYRTKRSRALAECKEIISEVHLRLPASARFPPKQGFGLFLHWKISSGLVCVRQSQRH